MRVLFFSRLDNPEWLAPLHELKIFDTVPEGIHDSAGARRWPEGDYLARVAAEHPQTANEIYRRHQDSPNPWVQRAILDGIATLPTAEASALTAVVVKIVTQASGWVEVEKILDLAQRLSVAGEMRSTARLLTALFMPRAGAGEETVFGTRARLAAPMDDYHYRELLTRAIPLLTAQPGISGLRLLIDWLCRAAEIRAGDSGPDHALSRSSIADHVQNSGGEDIADSLIVAVRDVAVQLGVAGLVGGILDLLDEQSLSILRRVGVEVAAQLLTREMPTASPRPMTCSRRRTRC